MRISTVKLINFKSYRNQVFTFPPPRGNKNLVLRACLETHLSIMKRFNSMLAMAI